MINTAILMGRLTADPELRHTSSDIAVTTFTLAVDRDYVKSGSERHTDFIDIVCWRNTAEFVSKYFHKGMLVAVQGSIQTRNYEDKQGNKRKAFEIVADNVHFAEPRKDNGNTQQYSGQESHPSRVEPTAPADNGDFVEIDGDDDLPF